MPHDDRGPLRGWSLAILGALEPVLTPRSGELGERSVRRVPRLPATARRRPSPQPGSDDDLLSRLIRDEDGGEPAVGDGAAAQLHLPAQRRPRDDDQPDRQRRRAAARASGRARRGCARSRSSSRRAVEECLRYESPNQLGNRLVIEPIEIGGVTFEPGAYLTLCIGAANRDPAAVPRPRSLRHRALAEPPPRLRRGRACLRRNVRRAARGADRGAADDAALSRAAARRSRCPRARARFRGWQTLPIACA